MVVEGVIGAAMVAEEPTALATAWNSDAPAPETVDVPTAALVVMG
jgi:hypothetical protein